MTRMTLGAALAALPLLIPAAARADITNDAVRQRAQQACYDDANKLCADAIPDEGKIEACMRVHRARLSPKCRAIFDANAK